LAIKKIHALHAPQSIQVGVIALYVFCGAIVLRALIYIYLELPSMFRWYAALELAFLLLFILVMVRPHLPRWLLHVIFLIQSVIIVSLLGLPPHLDFLTAQFVLLSYQMALFLPGKSRWIWCGIFCALILVCLIYWLGWVLGIALSMTPMVGCIIFLAYVIANREEELANKQSQEFLIELQEKNNQLQAYAAQAEQIATIEERNRLARELHDSVSQTIFSIMLNTRTAQILIERKPEQVRIQLEQLQALTQEALTEMRSLIAQLRPQKD
jgi:signal transduction histidine kinase